MCCKASLHRLGSRDAAQEVELASLRWIQPQWVNTGFAVGLQGVGWVERKQKGSVPKQGDRAVGGIVRDYARF